MLNLRDRLASALGVEQDTTSHTEKLISALGAMLGILSVCLISSYTLDTPASLLLTASIGASAVLIFAVPHGALSQPWSVLCGHAVSALIGISCQRWLPGHWLTPALAVGLAVGAMTYLRCIHPPGGATALITVIGGPEIHQLGYGFLLTPLLLNVSSILIIAVLFNGLFHWRRYPAVLARHHATAHPPAGSLPLTPDDFTAALRQMGSFIDITPEDLIDIVALAREHAAQAGLHADQIKAGAFYGNGMPDDQLAVRRVIDQSHPGARRDQLIYRVESGPEQRGNYVCSRRDFARWARCEVEQAHDGSWQPLDHR